MNDATRQHLNRKSWLSPRAHIWWWIIYLLLAELWLAYAIPGNIFVKAPFLAALVELTQNVAPVLGKITDQTAERPDAVRLYVLLTLAVVPLKVCLFYYWLNSDRTGIYRHLVVTPLTNQQPSGTDNFVSEPLRVEKGKAPSQKPRSLFSRLVWSTLILALTVGGCWVALEFFDPSTSSGRKHFRKLSAEGIAMWQEWTLELLTLTSFLLAISANILRDYGILLANLCGKLKENGS
jgi:hypothetical protein